MKLYFCINQYLTYLAEITGLIERIMEAGTPSLSDLYTFRHDFVRLAAVIPALKSDLNDSLRDEGRGVYDNKRDTLSAFENKCGEAQSLLRTMIANGYECPSASHLLMLFLKKFCHASGRTLASAMSDRIKPTCCKVLLEMSKTFGVDISPRAFIFGGYLDLKECTFNHCFKTMFGLNSVDITELYNSVNVTNRLLCTSNQTPAPPITEDDRCNTNDLFDGAETD
nr:P21 [Carrot closterovirus 2]